MTSATEKLRRLLDERGVEYHVRNDFVTYVYLDDRAITYFTDVVDGKMESVSVSVDFPKPVLNGTVWLTPEQAIAATLGRGKCGMDMLDTGNEAAYEHYEYIMHCENCHHEFGYVQYDEDGGTWMNDKPRFCPNCGCKVVDA